MAGIADSVVASGWICSGLTQIQDCLQDQIVYQQTKNFNYNFFNLKEILERM